MSHSPRRDFIRILLLATLIAAVSARPFAGGWNDASRLATIECLVDYRTFAIDDSVFVNVPAEDAPFTPYDKILHKTGTLDRMRFNGRYYSDKAPVPALYSAAIYKALQVTTGLNARRDAPVFCWLMHFLGSGLAYVVAVVCTFQTVRERGLSRRMTWTITLAFALATVAVAYAKYVNAHAMLLAVTSLLLWLMSRTAARLESGELRGLWQNWLAIGSLCGIAYTIDLGVGPIIILGVGGWALFRLWAEPRWGRRLAAVAILGLAALPWVALHHGINFAVFGALGPANSNPAMFTWPGSPFHSGNMTGAWNHRSVGAFLLYAIDILVGQRGFLSNNLMLYLAVVGIPPLLRLRFREKPELLCGLAWCAGAYLMYATLSNNYAGGCLSIRWFVPLLAPAFLGLALLLRERPEWTRDFVILSCWNVVWILPAWWYGPWWRPSLLLYWFVLAGGLTHWAIHQHIQVRRNGAAGGFVLQFFARVANNTIKTVRRVIPQRGIPHGTVEERL